MGNSISDQIQKDDRLHEEIEFLMTLENNWQNTKMINKTMHKIINAYFFESVTKKSLLDVLKLHIKRYNKLHCNNPNFTTINEDEYVRQKIDRLSQFLESYYFYVMHKEQS